MSDYLSDGSKELAYSSPNVALHRYWAFASLGLLGGPKYFPLKFFFLLCRARGCDIYLYTTTGFVDVDVFGGTSSLL